MIPPTIAIDAVTARPPRQPTETGHPTKFMDGSKSDVAVVEPPALTEDALERILAQELQQMSLKDREDINEEIHGVHNLAVQETSQLLLEKLGEMNEALLLHHIQPIDEAIDIDGGQTGNHRHSKSTKSKHTAYNEALMMQSRYIHDPAIHLMFLRSEFFDATRAAKRFITFLQLIRDYLGPEALVHEPWTLSTFNAEERKYIKQGVFQIVGRDRVGRLIHGHLDDNGSNVSLSTRFKIQVYLFMALAEDVETQQKGTVSLFYQGNHTTVLTISEVRAMQQRSIRFAPIRISAGHICIPNTPFTSFVKTLVMATATPHMRARCRFHSGSPTEILYSLQTFGISADQVPINTNTGTIKTQNHLKWLLMRQAMEEARASGGPNYVFQGISFPSHQDVLLGRGRPNLIHRGNVTMRHAVKLRLPRFAASTTTEERTAIIREVVLEVYHSGGRFLKECPNKKNGWWIEVDLETTMQKVGCHFRDQKPSQKAISTEPTSFATGEGSTLMLSEMYEPSPFYNNNQKDAATKSTQRQELDSSTYEFVWGQSRKHKRFKGNHCFEMWDDMCSP